MFTGLIEELGRIKEREASAEGGARLVIEAGFVDELVAGDSVAVNGVCLTAVDPSAGVFSADAMGVTLERSSLGDLEVGSVVNLERAVRADGRLGGHIVQGHVDGVGAVSATRRDGNALVVTVGCNVDLLRYMVPKGSNAVDGVSLTLAEVHEDGLDV